MKKYIVIALILLLLPFSVSALNVTSYNYTCSGSVSIENMTTNTTNGTIFNQINCANGCAIDNPLNCYTNRVPQCDLCNVYSKFQLDYIILGAFIGAVGFLSLFYMLTRRLPVPMRFFIWFIFFILELYLIYSLPFPSYLTGNQYTAAGIFTVITTIITAVFMLYSVM